MRTKNLLTDIKVSIKVRLPVSELVLLEIRLNIGDLDVRLFRVQQCRIDDVRVHDDGHVFRPEAFAVEVLLKRR